MGLLENLGHTLITTARDVLPIVAVLVVFQLAVLRQSIPHVQRLLVGSLCVLIGLVFFLVGLEGALFPLGRVMAEQLSDPTFLFGSEEVPETPSWSSYLWVYLFAACLGFTTTIAEPSLIAVAFKAEEVSRGSIRQWGLRFAVALGVGVGVMVGTLRIVTGTPIYAFMAVGYLVVVVQTWFAPKSIVPLAYDSGGVTTSTVTVPLVTALGLGLAETIPGRNPALDGFGLIAFASLFPMIAVMGYAQIVAFRTGRRRRDAAQKAASPPPIHTDPPA